MRPPPPLDDPLERALDDAWTLAEPWRRALATPPAGVDHGVAPDADRRRIERAARAHAAAARWVGRRSG